MRAAGGKILFVAFLSLCLVGCSVEEDPVEPLRSTNNSDLVGYDPDGCNLIQSFGQGALPRLVSLIEEDRVIMSVKAQRRGHNGKYLSEEQGLLLDPSQSLDMIEEFDRHMLGMAGLLTVHDGSGARVNKKGGRVIMDFSRVGSVMMKNMLLVDVGSAGATVELFSKHGQLLDKQHVVTEAKSARFIGFGDTPGVAKIIVTFGDERKLNGSGAIARLQMCIEGEGRCIPVCYGELNSMWLAYTGTKPINVKVSSKNGASSKVLFNGHGVKPGTMFRIVNASGFGESLAIETNRKENHIISLQCEASPSIKKQYGMFKVVQASGRGSLPVCLSD